MTLFRIALGPRSAAALAASVVALVAATSPALGQISLPDSVVNPPSGVLSADDRSQVTRYIDASKAGLSGNNDEVSAARKALLRPLLSSSVAQAFRLEYAKQLLPVVQPLVKSKNPDIAVNAVRIAGELATHDSIAVLAEALKDSNPAVRLTAAMGYERTFATVRGDSPSPAIVARDGSEAVKSLATAFAAEQDPLVADAIVYAFDAAIKANTSALPGVRQDAVKLLSDAIAVKARSADAMKFIASLARATDSLLDAVNDTRWVPARESLVDAAGVVGDIVSLALRQTEAGSPEGENLRNLKQVLAQAENLYFFAHTKIDPNGRPVRRGLAESLGTDNAKFRRDAIELRAKLTDPSGAFRIPADRYAAK